MIMIPEYRPVLHCSGQMSAANRGLGVGHNWGLQDKIYLSTRYSGKISYTFRNSAMLYASSEWYNDGYFTLALQLRKKRKGTPSPRNRCQQSTKLSISNQPSFLLHDPRFAMMSNSNCRRWWFPLSFLASHQHVFAGLVKANWALGYGKWPPAGCLRNPSFLCVWSKLGQRHPKTLCSVSLVDGYVVFSHRTLETDHKIIGFAGYLAHAYVMFWWKLHVF